MWYVHLDQTGVAKSQHFESQEDLVGWLERGLRMKRCGHNQWARGSKKLVILAGYREWSDAVRLVGQIAETAGTLQNV